MNWKTVTLGDASELLIGFAFKSDGFLSADSDGVPLVRGDNVQQGTIRWGDKTKKWSKDDFDELARYQLQLGDVILAMDRPIVGGGLKLAWVTQNDIPSLLVQRVCCIRGKRGIADTLYLRYALSHPSFSGHIDRITTGANIPHISGKDIAAYSFLLPQIHEQRCIGQAIAAYDDLIENNQRRIKLLEEAARRLYREWFVALRFPGHERVKVVDGVPQGWTYGALSDSLSYLNRGVSPKYDDSAPGLVVNQKCIRNGLLDLLPARQQAKEVPKEKLLQLGDVLINSTGTGTLGRVAVVRSPIGDCTVDTHVTIARPTNKASMAFWGVALLEMEARFSEMGVGATNQQELIRSHVGAIELLVPPTDLQADFHARAWPMLLQSDTLSKQSGVLRQARDALLPRLMSGALTV